jgi:YegS/Rv2252/BmrU family lipid kinase
MDERLAIKHVTVIINPASGKPEPILAPLNQVFSASNIEWDVAITHKDGDGIRLAEEAVDSGSDIVAVYGGDGTISEVVNGILNRRRNVPLAILPGGTANTLSRDLGISRNLLEAAALIVDPSHSFRRMDVGWVNEERCFILRLGVGVAAEPVRYADAERKSRLGMLAYVVATIEAFRSTEVARYHITVDGQKIIAQGRGCQLNNVPNIFIPGVAFPTDTSVDDGMLDLVLVGEVDLDNVSSKFSESDNESGVLQMLPEIFQQWKGHEFTIAAEPPHSVHLDGDMWGETPISVKVLPKVLSVLVPPPQLAADA